MGVTRVHIWQRKQLPPFQNKEPSVTVRNESPPECRSTQSELDRRAISVVGHLLTTAIMLEHQLRTIATPRTGLVGRSGWVRSPLRRPRSFDVQFTLPTGKQPSPIAEVALASR